MLTYMVFFIFGVINSNKVKVRVVYDVVVEYGGILFNKELL